jgi:hypothetical protein
MEEKPMQKGKINITMDKDLIEYAKIYASEQRTTVSEVLSQFILNLKRIKEDEPIHVILSDPDFAKSFSDTISRIQSGKVKWSRYEEVF